MPGGDRTGPRGMGPMTGRGMGLCEGYDVPGYANPMPGGRGMYGRGMYGRGGGGRGWRNMYYATGLPGYARAARGMQAWGGGPYPIQDPYAAPMTSENELAILKAESGNLVQALEDIKKRIGELETEVKKK